jgi:hypothetical protein
MYPDDVSLKIIRGDTFTLTVTVNSVNLTGATVRMTGRTRESATTTVFAVSSSGASPAITFTASTNSVITVVIPAATTAAFDAPLNGRWDIEYELGSYKETIVRGPFDIQEDTTR